MSIINIDESKCVGCNSCVRVCPSLDANTASLDKSGNIIININDDKCIKCGACINACTHNARYYVDDTEEFIKDLDKNEEMAVIVAPAIKLALQENWAGLLTWLKNRGVTFIYDVSLGADICTWAHLKYLKKNSDAKIITQPCAAVVNYVLKHQHDLVDKLSPVQSPMLCTAIYLRKYKGFTGKIAAISPCIAKKDEFAQTDNIINYNVTVEKLKEYLKQKKINYSVLAEKDKFKFDGPRGYMGSVYPNPGGLRANLRTHAPEVFCINSEGVSKVYKELNQYVKEDEENLPQVFDVLNCEFGCNDGPGMGQSYDLFKMRAVMANTEKMALADRDKNITKKGEDKQFAEFDVAFRLDDFLRRYDIENVVNIKANEEDINEAFKKLKKVSESDKKHDCHACGYTSCRAMAEAIFKGNNVPENCSQFYNKVLSEEQKHLDDMSNGVYDIAKEMEDIIVLLANNISEVDAQVSQIQESGNVSTAKMGEVVEYIKSLDEMTATVNNMMKTIENNVEDYSEMTGSVRTIAGKINLLSLNAAIESARAGDAGRAFAVVANNIRTLSDSSKRSVESAEENEETIKKSIENVNVTVSEFSNRFASLIEMIEGAKGSVNTVSDNSTMISDSMKKINGISERLATMVKKTDTFLK